MKEKLGQLTVAQFVDLIAGDARVLLESDEKASTTVLTIAMRNIVLEYKEITDSAGLKSYLSFVDDLIKAKIGIIVFSMCQNLILLHSYDNARTILTECGVACARMTNERLAAEVDSRLERSRRMVDELESERNTADEAGPKNVRNEFDAQSAALMAHFKFQIDPLTMKASIYANLVNRCNREVKTMAAAWKYR